MVSEYIAPWYRNILQNNDIPRSNVLRFQKGQNTNPFQKEALHNILNFLKVAKNCLKNIAYLPKGKHRKTSTSPQKAEHGKIV